MAGIAREAGRSAWRIGLDGGETLEADALLLATEGWSGAPLFAGVAPELSATLAGVRHPPVAVVALGFGEDALERCPRGFGALLPREEGYRILGVLWDSHLFPGRSEPGTILMRAMLGGATDTELGALEEAEIERIAEEDVMRLLALREPAAFRYTRLWKRAIPQYEMDHPEQARSAQEAVERACHAGRLLGVAGNTFGGISFGDSAETGWKGGERLARLLLANGA